MAQNDLFDRCRPVDARWCVFTERAAKTQHSDTRKPGRIACYDCIYEVRGSDCDRGHGGGLDGGGREHGCDCVGDTMARVSGCGSFVPAMYSEHDKIVAGIRSGSDDKCAEQYEALE